jgi:hypothetical protein
MQGDCDMNAQQFESRLRALIRAQPFVPFVIAVDDGRTIPVSEPAVAFSGGAATVEDAAGEIHLLKCEQILDFKVLSNGSTGQSDSQAAKDQSQSGGRPTMTTEQFEQTMSTFLRREPFEPFVVRTDHDLLILIANPKAVALAAGGAGYISPERIYFIESADVLEIRSMKEQIAQ